MDYSPEIIKLLKSTPEQAWTAKDLAEQLVQESRPKAIHLALRWQLLVLGLTHQIRCKIDETILSKPSTFLFRFDHAIHWRHNNMPF